MFLLLILVFVSNQEVKNLSTSGNLGVINYLGNGLGFERIKKAKN